LDKIFGFNLSNKTLQGVSKKRGKRTPHGKVYTTFPSYGLLT